MVTAGKLPLELPPAQFDEELRFRKVELFSGCIKSLEVGCDISNRRFFRIDGGEPIYCQLIRLPSP
jgi:hypothetical protein